MLTFLKSKMLAKQTILKNKFKQIDQYNRLTYYYMSPNPLNASSMLENLYIIKVVLIL